MNGRLFFLILMAVSVSLYCQSRVIYKAGTTIRVGTGAIVRSDSITVNGAFFINGTMLHSYFASGTPVSITLLPQGYAANAAQNAALPGELFTIHIAGTSAPYADVEAHTASINNSTLTAKATFSALASGNYYVYVTHHNTIETWSKLGGEPLTAHSPFAYDFTTAKTQAYGDNLILSHGKYCLYSGDVDSSGFIDNNDLLAIDNDAFHFVTGTAITDLDGSQFVDSNDLLICDNNAFNYIGVQKPHAGGAMGKRPVRSVKVRNSEAGQTEQSK